MECSRIIVERTCDLSAIEELARHPAIFGRISDDSVTDPQKWQAPDADHIRYLIARDTKGNFGFGVFIPRTWTCWDSHVGFLPRSYGDKTVASFKQMIEWMWKNTSARRITGEVAQENRLAIKFAVNAGFEKYGVNRASRLKGGVLQDQVCLGISKP